ncbi:hemerythrin domain-containing protein [Photobacterium sp.]|uniref:hemerythrin domain-containing protein n=1 Tax=Photobacterium sp. TaxID=660 RepID=UPI00299D31B8|nr:hemerythrin domain-containing protein [Photobacterium sp.]MDX1303521.1 hemerythrin domain-containing protein [Photobacterium sp.]
MATIKNFMTEHHRSCDHLLVEAEGPLSQGNWAEFSNKWNQFEAETLHHFDLEEEILFPEFEAKTGMTSGPTMVMRQEHTMVRALFSQMQQAISENATDRAMGIVESTMLLIQQHNMKEEQMLYPMSDAHLTNGEELVAQMKVKPVITK